MLGHQVTLTDSGGTQLTVREVGGCVPAITDLMRNVSSDAVIQGIIRSLAAPFAADGELDLDAQRVELRGARVWRPRLDRRQHHRRGDAP